MKFALGVIYQTDPDDAARIPAMLQEIVEANGGTFIRSGFIGFGPSSLDFELEFDVFVPDFEKVYQARHQIGQIGRASCRASVSLSVEICGGVVRIKQKQKTIIIDHC